MQIDGDTEYYDSNFQNSTPRSPPPDAAQDVAYEYVLCPPLP
jgi:hypothetical protein